MCAILVEGNMGNIYVKPVFKEEMFKEKLRAEGRTHNWRWMKTDHNRSPQLKK